MTSTPKAPKNGPTPTPLGRRLREQREIRGWSQEQFAAIANIATGMVSQLETGKRGKGVGRDIVLRIARAMTEPAEWWLDLAGLPYADSTPSEFRPSVTAAIDYDPHLTRAQKRALKTKYQEFLSGQSSS